LDFADLPCIELLNFVPPEIYDEAFSEVGILVGQKRRRPEEIIDCIEAKKN